MRRLSAAFIAVSFVVVAACSSSKSGGIGGASPCQGFCSHVKASANCQDLDVAGCVSDCEAEVALCPWRSGPVLECLTSLSITCTGPGQAYASPNGPAAASPVYLTAAGSSVEIQDAACAERADDFIACEPIASGGAGGSGGVSGSGGNGGTGGPSEGGSGGTPAGGGSGGTGGNDCSSSFPYHCPASDTCWPEEVDCSTAKQCAGEWVVCSAANGANGYSVDCAWEKCVPGPSSCTEADHPVYCPARHGASPGCYTPGSQCNTVVYCDGIGAKACSQANQAVDCSANLCLTPKSNESSNAACSNNLDDDGNGYADCDDFHCMANPAVSVCNAEVDDGACSNSQDDDGSGYADCQDYTCQISPSVQVCNGESTDSECHDAVDNDSDGKTDCADNSCLFSPFATCP